MQPDPVGSIVASRIRELPVVCVQLGFITEYGETVESSL
jgi:hypothetical protein